MASTPQGSVVGPSCFLRHAVRTWPCSRGSTELKGSAIANSRIVVSDTRRLTPSLRRIAQPRSSDNRSVSFRLCMPDSKPTSIVRSSVAADHLRPRAARGSGTAENRTPPRPTASAPAARRRLRSSLVTASPVAFEFRVPRRRDNHPRPLVFSLSRPDEVTALKDPLLLQVFPAKRHLSTSGLYTNVARCTGSQG